MDSFFFFIPYFLEFGDILIEIRKIEPRDFV
ncbi:GNAT family N-acetyltransferase, partial [Citrobacter sp. TBCS-11]